MFMNGDDPFDGLRDLPRDPAQLRHHLSRINHTLQTKYFITPETAELALQPERTRDFCRFYQREVQRVVSHFSKATRSHIKVSVDPMRLAKGMELERVGKADDENAFTPPVHPPEDPAWVADMIERGRKLAQQTLLEQQQAAAEAGQGVGVFDASCTPAQQLKGGIYKSSEAVDDGMPTTGMKDSESKPDKDSCLFSTPPEFKGFAVPTGATPSESEGGSPLH